MLKKKNKQELITLEKPTIFRRLWKLYLYNIIVSAIVFYAFFGFWTLDDVAFELDYFMFYLFVDLRYQVFIAVLSFWLMFRQIFKLLNLIKYRRIMILSDVAVVVKKSYKRTRDGEEGAGKTLLQTHDSILVACDKNEKMNFEYFLKYPFREELKDDKNFKVLQESFEFYQKNPNKMPNYMANYDVEFDGKKQYDFDMGYLDQTKRPAESFCLSLTEIANLFPNRESRLPKDEKKDTHNMIKKNETFSLSRQWFDMHIFADEQREGEIFLGFRSLSSSSTILSSRTILEPKFLLFILTCVGKLIDTLKLSNKKFFSKVYLFLLKITSSIGFLAFDELNNSTGNLETKVISRDLFFSFDTRGERENYELYDKEPDFEVPKAVDKDTK